MVKEFNFTDNNDWLLPFLEAFKKQNEITDIEDFAIKNVEKIFKKNIIDSVVSIFSGSNEEPTWKECAKSYTLNEIATGCRNSPGFDDKSVPKKFSYNNSKEKGSDEYKQSVQSYDYLRYSDDINKIIIDTPSSDYTRRDDVLHKYRLIEYLQKKEAEDYATKYRLIEYLQKKEAEDYATKYKNWIDILIAAYENTDIIVIVNEFSNIKYTTDAAANNDFEFLKSHTPADIIEHKKLNLDISNGLNRTTDTSTTSPIPISPLLRKGGKRTKKRKSKTSKKTSKKRTKKRKRR
jgi:hypothetical protein